MQNQSGCYICLDSDSLKMAIHVKRPLKWLAAWRSGNGVGRINEVTLRRAWLVLGWVTCPGSTPGGDTLLKFISVCNQPPKANSAFHPFGVDKLSSEQLYRMYAGRTIW